MTGFASPARGDRLDASIRQLWDNGERRAAVRAALDGWDRLLREGTNLHWLENVLRTCGLHREAFALQAHMIRAQPGNAESWAQLIRSVLDSGDPWWAHQLLEEALVPARPLDALRIETALTVGAAAPLISAWIHNHHDQAARAAAVDWWVRAGRLDEAERVLHDTPGLEVWQARFALWRDQPESALALLQRCPDGPEVRCLAAIAAARQGKLEAAEAALRQLLDGEQRANAYGWLAFVLRRQGRFAEAAQAADAASLADPSFNLVARIEHALSDASARASGRNAFSTFSRWRRWIELRLRSIQALELAPALYGFGLSPGDALATLAPLLERFGGNHTSSLTTVEAGHLAAHQVPVDPRHLGASIQRVLWTRGADAARALYADLAPSVDRHPLFLIYHGELELWLGAYETAARIFGEALGRNRRVRWAWIGLGASAMFQGDLHEALRIWNRGRSFTDWRTGFAGPTLYAYRGECHRRLGRADRARRDLEMAIRHKPQRLSARINMALLDQRPAELEALIRECTVLAPILMEEIDGSPAARLETVLDAMRGNRSSSPWQVTFHLWDHLWRRAG